MKQRRQVTFQAFDEYGNVIREFTDERMVYTRKDGRMRINFLEGQRPVVLEGNRILAFGGQRLPCIQPVTKWRGQ